ncbi:MAG: hypothetical protein EA378_10515 [Phycisphaerales bacterium]|nr:MAG: hypothetical protein EA378_10515 [Phycisphaerales bacterium]
MRPERLVALRLQLVSHEFWPTWVRYVPIAGVIALESLRSGGLRTVLCANPGIPAAGLVGEHKTDILDHFPPGPHTLPTFRIPPGEPAERLARLRELQREHPELGDDPLVLKPERGYRGFAVRIVRSDDDAIAYFRDVPIPASVQRYHPGPVEVGLLWARHLDQVEREDPERPAGRILDICSKTFPEIVGDGVRTIEDLVWREPRLAVQRRVLLSRVRDAHAVPGKGERVALGEIGNHIQGTKFTDGMRLHTPALAAAVDALARSYRDAEGRGLDIGRFDARAESNADLQAGRFAVLEFNGIAGEPTSMYDPARTPIGCWATLARWVRTAYALGRARRRLGVRPVSWRELYQLKRRDAAERRLGASST